LTQPEALEGRIADALAAGDLAAAATEGIRGYGRELLRYLGSLLGDEDAAGDAFAETCAKIWRGLADFRSDSSFRTWLYQIVTRRALNKLHRGRNTGSLNLLAENPDPGPEPAAAAERNFAADAVTDALAALPFPQRAAVVLHHFEGLSYADVADVTHSSVPAVRSQLFRARRTLGTKLQQWR